jgi:pyruvate dehydrogenase E2 component (dihydrolipoamide acetyltransferase)
VVTARFGEPGEERPVGAPLITVAADGAEREGSGSVLVGYGTTEGRRTRRRRVSQAPPSAPAADGPVPVISPLVRRMARTHGLDLRSIRGSGPDGLITRADVQRALDGERARPAEQQPAAAAEVTPLRGLARAAAETFTRSHREIPDATCWVDADATELLAAREALNASAGSPRIGLLALLARICVLALVRHPELNSTVVDGPSGPGLRRNPRVHLGVAAQTDRGLLVPVIRDADRLSTERLAAALTGTAAAAREGRLAPADLTGGTFTLNNYGVYGVDGSTPIINHPEAAMLGIGRIAAKPWVHQGELAVRQVVQLSLTFDHRTCDGATAGNFLREVADAVESPVTLLRDL